MRKLEPVATIMEYRVPDPKEQPDKEGGTYPNGWPVTVAFDDEWKTWNATVSLDSATFTHNTPEEALENLAKVARRFANSILDGTEE